MYRNSWPEDLAARPPAVIIDSNARQYTKYPLLKQPWFRDWLPNRYAEISTAALRTTGFRAYLPLRRVQEAPPTDPTLIARIRLEDDDTKQPLLRVQVHPPADAESLSLMVGEDIICTLPLVAGEADLVSFPLPYSNTRVKRHGPRVHRISPRHADRQSAVPSSPLHVNWTVTEPPSFPRPD
ncbi:MAG: hypothetical protein J6386_01950 [Candidatus Synoicihabitans palmerolidicus]|nr:hypothetical protein [Candidatus Synoicihabitans palmerolidicus]